MRSALDSRRHFKNKTLGESLPEFCEAGTIVEGPSDFHYGRIANRDRSSTVTGDVLVAEAASSQLKRRYSELQRIKQTGRRGRYELLKAKRHKSVN